MESLAGNNFSNFSSNRVEDFAIHCLKILFKRFGYKEPSDTDAKTIVNSCGFDTIIKKCKEYSTLKHNSKYGPLERNDQAELNLKIVIYDIIGRTNNEKKELIFKFIREHEQFIEKKNESKLKNENLIKIISRFELNSSEFQIFNRKADNLYSIQKGKIRRLIRDDTFYNESIAKLDEIYSKHIERMVVFLIKSENE
jgi:hypothetical protein